MFLLPRFNMLGRVAFIFFILVRLTNLTHSSDPEENDRDLRNILSWKPPPEFLPKYPYTLLGHDYDGAPVIYCEFGKWDIRSTLNKSSKMEELLHKYVYQAVVRLTECGNATEDCQGSVVIADMDGFSVVQAAHRKTLDFVIRIFQKIGKVFQTSSIKMILVINANQITRQVWIWGRPFLGSAASIFELFGTNPATWKPKILKLVPASELPEFLGGKANHSVLKVYG